MIGSTTEETIYMPITTVNVLDCLRKMADVIHENKEHLTDGR